MDCAPAHDKKFIRLSFMLAPSQEAVTEEMNRVLLDHYQSEWKHGAAPPNHLEREIQQWIDDHTDE